MTNNEVYAYTAGLIDGEGAIMLVKSPTFYTVRVTVVMTDMRPIDWLYRHFSGNRTDQAVRNIEHAPGYRWDISSKNKVSAFLIPIIPYLQVKKLQAELAVQFCREFDLKRKCRMSDSDRVSGERYFQIIRLLNSKGADSQELKARISLSLVGDASA